MSETSIAKYHSDIEHRLRRSRSRRLAVGVLSLFASAVAVIFGDSMSTLILLGVGGISLSGYLDANGSLKEVRQRSRRAAVHPMAALSSGKPTTAVRATASQ